jgi:hypothetical protein
MQDNPAAQLFLANARQLLRDNRDLVIGHGNQNYLGR